jgi:hypothetical protein
MADSQGKFRKGNYVRFIGSGLPRWGYLVSDADSDGRFSYQHDPRIEGGAGTSLVREEEIEFCPLPVMHEIESINKETRSVLGARSKGRRKGKATASSPVSPGQAEGGRYNSQFKERV